MHRAKDRKQAGLFSDRLRNCTLQALSRVASTSHPPTASWIVHIHTMSETTTVTTKRKLRPARKQVKAGDIDKSEGPQPGKEYSKSSSVTASNLPSYVRC